MIGARSRDPAAARAAHEKALHSVMTQMEDAPEIPRLHLRAGCLLHALGRFDEARAALQRAVHLAPEEHVGWYWLAAASVACGEMPEALAAAARYDALGPEDAAGYAWRANLFRLAGDPGRGMACAERALTPDRAEPPRPWVVRVAVRCARAVGDVARQRDLLRDVLRSNPRDRGALEEFGYTFVERNEYAQAVPEFRRIVEADPENGLAWYSLGASLTRIGRSGEAIAALQCALAAGEDTARARAELGNAHLRSGDHRAAIPELDRALQMEPDAGLVSSVHGGLGFAHAGLKEPEAALHHYETAVAADPDNATARHGLGAAYAAVRDDDSAALHLREAVRLAPEDGEAWARLGHVLWRSGDLADARSSLERALSLGEADVMVKTKLASVYHLQGCHPLAAETARRALRQNPPKKWRPWLAGVVRDATRGRR